jgi:thiosulfate/3-mercaptopyruvate sulfurtransferase
MNRPLISATELAAIVDGVVLIDARPSAEYGKAHLLDARNADLDVHLSAAREAGADPANGGRHPLPSLDRFLRQLGAWGIGPETNVVVYDAQSGANAAARAWWMLRAVGHERVAVLDGGLAAAIEAGLATTADAPHVVPRDRYPAEGWSLPVVDMQQVESLRRDREWRVLDVRSRERFRGETEPIDPIAGHIPGAINLPYAENLEGDRYKSPAALRSQYGQLLGDVPPGRLVVHCGSGVTACHTLLALEAAGLTGASLYVGSWSEWCRNEAPRATGD